jgi:uncharacterized protein
VKGEIGRFLGLGRVLGKWAEIGALCRQRQVAKLELFGSATGDRYDSATSDLDFLVEFAVDTPQGAAQRYFGLKQGLADIFGCAIDLVELKTLRNPYFLDAIALTRITIYENEAFAMMSDRDHQILREFSARVRQQFPEAQIWAFGSRARGDAQPDSDLDICVVIDNLSHSTWKAISHIAWEIGFENDLLITTVKYSRQQFESSPYSVSPLIKNILREGVAA